MATNNQYFDLHFHPSFKSFLTDPDPAKKLSCWETIQSDLDILRSQSSLQQMVNGCVSLGIATIITLEKPYSENFLIRHLLGPLGLAPINKKMLNDRDGYRNFLFLNEELSHLEYSVNHPQPSPPSPIAIQILKNKAEYDENKFNLVLAIEGAHSLELKHSSMVDTLNQLRLKYRILYLTLVHQTQYDTCNHADTVKLLKDKVFHPKGIGLFDKGKELIDAAYTGDKPTLIDIKHMSLGSRQDFYKFRKDKGYENFPILATHIGVTGISFKELPQLQYDYKLINPEGCLVKYRELPQGLTFPGTLKKYHFWPCSANLYNEDIMEVITSKGLIGLILDKRSLGIKEKASEYVSKEEFKQYFKQETIGIQFLSYKNAFINLDLVEESEEIEGEENTAILAQKVMERPGAANHLWSISNQIIHIIGTFYKLTDTEIDPWKHICIGSDFDGFVSPPHCCMSQEEFQVLEIELVKIFPQVIVAANKDGKYQNNSNFGIDELDDSKNIAARIRGIMFENGRDFILEHL